MDCERWNSINDYLDGCGDPREAASAAAHLQNCPVCKETAEMLAALNVTLRSARRLDPGPCFTAKVMARVREESAFAREVSSRLQLSSGEAISLALLYGILALVLLPIQDWFFGGSKADLVPNLLRGWWHRMGTWVTGAWGGDLQAWFAAVPGSVAAVAAITAAGVLGFLCWQGARGGAAGR